MIAPFEYRRGQTQRLRVLITAAEAYPALEGAFLDANTEIHASFRVFDLRTRLHSDAARAVGSTWFDLIVHTLARGVAIRMVISDFDPVAWPEGHRGTWRSVRMFMAAAELAGEGARLRVIPALHPARTGLLPRVVLWPMVMLRLLRSARRLGALDPGPRALALRELPGVAEKLVALPDGRLRCPLAAFPPLVPATHHQKLAVFDRELLYIGGLDLDERRYDTPAHDRPADETWHDVQLMLRGRVVDEAQRHLETFLAVTAGQEPPGPQRRLLRTMSRPRRVQFAHLGPFPVAEDIATGHAVLARRASRLIYLESQYFRDRRLARMLARIGRQTPGPGLIVMLPAAPDDVAFEGNTGLDARLGEWLQARCLKILRRGFGSRLFVGTMAQPRAGTQGAGDVDTDATGRDLLFGAPIIYQHAKVSIFDDQAAIVSSANLNGRSLRWDTEAGVYLNQPEDVQLLRRRVMTHWLPRNAGRAELAPLLDPGTGVAAWRTLAEDNARAAPARRRGFLLPYDFARPARFGQPVPVVPDEMV